MAAYMSKRLEHILQDICRTHKLEFFLINPARIVSNWSWVAKGPHWERIPICFSSLRTCCNRTFASESACFEMQLARPSGIFTASWIVCIRFTACSISGSVVALLHWSSAHIPKRCEWLKIAVSQGSRFSNLCACCTATANSTGSGPFWCPARFWYIAISHRYTPPPASLWGQSCRSLCLRVRAQILIGWRSVGTRKPTPIFLRAVALAAHLQKNSQRDIPSTVIWTKC